jgi:DNA-binding winged helix-turn-helix (wHTH) protein
MLRFADFELDRGASELRRGGRVVHLERIPLDLLFLLAERRGQLVPRVEIVERIWGNGGSQDSDASIDAAVRKIRRALGDDTNAPQFIITVPAKGYRFMADVREEPVATADLRLGQTSAVEPIRDGSEHPASHGEAPLAESPLCRPHLVNALPYRSSVTCTT